MTRARILLVFQVAILMNATAFASNILFLLPLSTQSYRLFLVPFLEALASRGHNVTLITNSNTMLTSLINEYPYPTNTAIFTKINDLAFKTTKNRPDQFMSILASWSGKHICRDFTKQNFLKEKKKFDVVFVSSILEACGLPVAKLMSDTIVVLQFMRVFQPFIKSYDMYEPYAYVPFAFSLLKGDMTFFERTWSALQAFYFSHFYLDYSDLEKTMRQEIPDGLPIQEVHGKVSLVFSNTGPVISYAKPQMPHVVSIGGLACRNSQPLPQHLESLMASGGDSGAILFSIGTVADFQMFSKDFAAMLLSTFAQLNQTVIWASKVALPGASTNIHFVPWIPQQDILGHPKLRLFITQGGIFSLHEAIYHGVPIIGLPIIADQFSNVLRMEELGLGLRLDVFDLTEERLLSTINSILDNSSFSENAKKASSIFRDQPETPLERALFWTDYAIRHPGFLHLRSSSKDMNNFFYFSLDVIVVILLSGLIVSLCINLFLRLVCKKRSGVLIAVKQSGK